MESFQFTGELFSEFNSDATNSAFVPIIGDNRDRKKMIHNLNLYHDFKTEGFWGIPVADAYYGDLPGDFISYSDRNKHLYPYGIQCFTYDYKIEPTWSRPLSSLNCLKNYKCVVAPDFSLFVDLPHCINIWNVYRKMWVTSFWQSRGVKVIPSASWGNVDSFQYCFCGLPEGGTIAIGHIVVGRDKAYKRLYRMGVEKLIDFKHPDKLLVYGSKLDFCPDVETVYYNDHIYKMRNML